MGVHDAGRSGGLERPTATEMREAIQIPESVSPEGLRARADLVRRIGDESCARHLELAADEFVRLREPKKNDPDLEATAWTWTAVEKTTHEIKLSLIREKQVLGYLVLPAEKVYDLGDHFLRLYDQLEGIE